MGGPRLVVTDFGGTLVRSDGTVSQRTAAALARVERVGSTVVIATARPPRSMALVAEASAGHGVAICANGAGLYDLHTDQVLQARPVDPAVLDDVMTRLRATLPGCAFAAEYADRSVREEAYPAWGPKVEVGESAALAAHPAIKLIAHCPALDLDTLHETAEAVVGDQVELTHTGYAGLLEITASGVTKASTLALLCADRGIDPHDVIAFGDMPNDLPLLRWAGTAYAVANAHPHVLAAVEHHTASNDTDGVAQTLERLFPYNQAGAYT